MGGSQPLDPHHSNNSEGLTGWFPAILFSLVNRSMVRLCLVVSSALLSSPWDAEGLYFSLLSPLLMLVTLQVLHACSRLGLECFITGEHLKT